MSSSSSGWCSRACSARAKVKVGTSRGSVSPSGRPSRSLWYSAQTAARRWSVLRISSCSADRDQLFGHRGEDLGPVGGDVDEILDPDPERTRHIHARLDRDDVALLERRIRPLRQPWRLVDLDPDSVPEAVA